MQENEFSVFVPLDTQDLAKSINGGEHGNYVRGWASTPDLDRHGDIVLPSEMNINEFLSRGYINYEHKPGEQFKIGVPTTKSYIDPQRGLYVEAKLFMDNPYAQRMWELAKNISKNGVSRPLGFSIEGRFHGRDADNPAILRGVEIKEVALTTNPANTNATWEAFVKSFETGYEIDSVSQDGVASLRKQSLARQLRTLSFAIKDFKAKDWADVAKTLDEEDRFDDDLAVLFTQLHRGLSREEASKFVNRT